MTSISALVNHSTHLLAISIWPFAPSGLRQNDFIPSDYKQQSLQPPTNIPYHFVGSIEVPWFLADPDPRNLSFGCWSVEVPQNSGHPRVSYSYTFRSVRSFQRYQNWIRNFGLTAYWPMFRFLGIMRCQELSPSSGEEASSCLRR